VVDVDYLEKEIYSATEAAIKKDHFPPSEIYGNGNSGEKIAEILATAELKFSKTISY